jgi:outer membrane protein TolC
MNRQPTFALVATLWALALPAHSAGLADAFSAAIEHDEAFRAQRLERDAQQLSVPIARAALLPNVSLSSTHQTNRGDRTQTFFGLDSTQPLDYRSQQSVLSLRQPLYHPDAYIRHEQSKLLGTQADAVLRGRRMELALQVGSAYFDVLFAQDTLALVDAEVASALGQISAARDRYARGEGTLTEVAEAQARHDLAAARRVDAQDRIITTRGEFTRLTGMTAPRLRRPSAKAADIALDPAELAQWLKLAQENSAELQALRVQADNARLEVDRNRSGHHPPASISSPA